MTEFPQAVSAITPIERGGALDGSVRETPAQLPPYVRCPVCKRHYRREVYGDHKARAHPSWEGVKVDPQLWGLVEQIVEEQYGGDRRGIQILGKYHVEITNEHLYRRTA